MTIYEDKIALALGKKFYEFSKPSRDVVSGRFLKKGEKDGN